MENTSLWITLVSLTPKPVINVLSSSHIVTPTSRCWLQGKKFTKQLHCMLDEFQRNFDKFGHRHYLKTRGKKRARERLLLHNNNKSKAHFLLFSQEHFVEQLECILKLIHTHWHFRCFNQPSSTTSLVIDNLQNQRPLFYTILDQVSFGLSHRKRKGF